jgi:hypothetical protein
MRAMSSGVHLARKMDGSITIYWRKNRECFADFSDLFQVVGIPDVKVRPYPGAALYLSVDRKKNLHLPGLLRRLYYDKQIYGRRECLDESLLGELPAGKTYIASGYSLSTHFPLKELFVPVPEIMERIELLKQRFTGPVIGIHIRRGDNLHSIQNNPVEDYFRFMDSEIEANPQTLFYLATDSPEVKTAMTTRYDHRILSHPAVLERHSLRGMQDAVIDLWCLSSTDRIVGSYFSSYSDLAAEMGGIELRILG